MGMEFRQILTGWIIRCLNPSDTELLRALHSRNSKNICNQFIFLQKMATGVFPAAVFRSKVYISFFSYLSKQICTG